MSNAEIINLLECLMPEDDRQARLIEHVCNLFRMESETPLDKYLETLNINIVANQTTDRVYERYVKYCNCNKIECVKKNTFTRGIKQKFNVKSEPRKINGKSIRCYIVSTI